MMFTTGERPASVVHGSVADRHGTHARMSASKLYEDNKQPWTSVV